MLSMTFICIDSASLLFILHHYHILHPAHNTLQLCYPCSNQLPLRKSQDSFPTHHTGGHGSVLASGSAWSFCDSLINTIFELPNDCVVLPGHNVGGCRHSTVGQERETWIAQCGNTIEDFVNFVSHKTVTNNPLQKDSNIVVASNMKDGAKPFHLRSLRTKVKERWGIFG